MFLYVAWNRQQKSSSWFYDKSEGYFRENTELLKL